MGIEPTRAGLPELENKQFGAMADPKCDGRVNFRGMWGHVGLRKDTSVGEIRGSSLPRVGLLPESRASFAQTGVSNRGSTCARETLIQLRILACLVMHVAKSVQSNAISCPWHSPRYSRAHIVRRIRLVDFLGQTQTTTERIQPLPI
jgi:hypothetical protein